MVLGQAKQEIIKLLKTASEVETLNEADIVLPPDSELGDLSFPCFGLAKIIKKTTAEVAQELKTKILESLQKQGLIQTVEAAGPYLNFFLNKEKVAHEILKSPSIPLLQRGRYSKSSPFEQGRDREGFFGQRIMIEFVSPNNNKPLHLGHLRNAFLGESVARLLESQGAKVIRACLFNDRGLSIAKSILAYKLWNKGKTPAKLKIKGDKFVGDLYVEFEKKSKDNPQLADEAEKTVILWENGDKEIKKLWKTLNTWVLGGFAQTLKRLKIKFNISYFESKLWKKGKELVAKGLEKKILKKDEKGAVIADLKNFNLPPKVMLRSNNTAIYSTSDLYLGQKKFQKNKLDKAIWCVGSEQDLYLQQLFAIYQMFDFPWFNKCQHLSYGLVFLPEGKMKSREGKVVEADDLLDELHNLALEEILKRNAVGEVRHRVAPAAEVRPRGVAPSISEKNRAEAIAQAALRFYLLSVTPKTTVHFNPEESIAFTGHTGPYLLYTYARISSILKRASSTSPSPLAGEGGGEGVTGGGASSGLEWHLIFHLSRFPEVVRESAAQYDPSHLAQYLYDLAKKFSEFYEAIPVLKTGPPTRATRLNLIRAVQNTMKNGLKLLTIDVIKKM